MAPQRRRSDPKEGLNGWILSLAKAAISLFFLGGLSFIGTWVVGLATTVAAMKDDVQMLKEKDRMMSEMVWPEMMDQVKSLRGEIKELRGELKNERRR